MDIELQDLSSVRDQPFLRGQPLADLELGRSGTVDVLLSVVDTNRCMHDISVSSPDRSTAPGSPSLTGSWEARSTTASAA